MNSMTGDERFSRFLSEGQDWERKATSIQGVFILRLPAFKGRAASLAIQINPVDSSGSATKKKGIIIRSASELEEISSLLRNPKISQLAKNIDEINPKRKESSDTKYNSDIFEI